MLSARLSGLVGGVPHAQFQGVVALNQRRGDIEIEWSVSTGVATHLYTVNPHVGFPVNGTEMQNHIFSFPVGRHGERTLIPEFVFLTHSLFNTG